MGKSDAGRTQGRSAQGAMTVDMVTWATHMSVVTSGNNLSGELRLVQFIVRVLFAFEKSFNV